MARGRLRAIGTSVRLKQKFGAGYVLSISPAGAARSYSDLAMAAAAGRHGEAIKDFVRWGGCFFGGGGGLRGFVGSVREGGGWREARRGLGRPGLGVDGGARGPGAGRGARVRGGGAAAGGGGVSAQARTGASNRGHAPPKTPQKRSKQP
jgi:hypothetical protein